MLKKFAKKLVFGPFLVAKTEPIFWHQNVCHSNGKSIERSQKMYQNMGFKTAPKKSSRVEEKVDPRLRKTSILG